MYQETKTDQEIAPTGCPSIGVTPDRSRLQPQRDRFRFDGRAVGGLSTCATTSTPLSRGTWTIILGNPFAPGTLGIFLNSHAAIGANCLLRRCLLMSCVSGASKFPPLSVRQLFCFLLSLYRVYILPFNCCARRLARRTLKRARFSARVPTIFAIQADVPLPQCHSIHPLRI